MAPLSVQEEYWRVSFLRSVLEWHYLRQHVPLQADGTTLGADNGIGVATALALLDLPNSVEYPLPPLECLFTVDEETGLTGAFDLDPSLLTGTSPSSD